MNHKGIKDILFFNAQKVQAVIKLVQASLSSIGNFNYKKEYTPKELEPYDALSDRFIRAVEISIKFFRSYELYVDAKYSETLRDQLNKMEKLEIISSTFLWLKMRDIRNRIVHDYLPEEIKDIYDSIKNEFSKELIKLKDKITKILTKEKSPDRTD